MKSLGAAIGAESCPSRPLRRLGNVVKELRIAADQREVIFWHTKERSRLPTGCFLAVQAVTHGDEGGIGIEREFDGSTCAMASVLLLPFRWTSLLRAMSARGHPGCDQFAELFLSSGHRLAAFTRVPGPPHKMVFRQMDADLFQAPVSVPGGVFDLFTNLADGQPLPGHRCRRQDPMLRAGNAADAGAGRGRIPGLMARRAGKARRQRCPHRKKSAGRGGADRRPGSGCA